MKRNVVEMILGAVVLVIAGLFLIFSFDAAEMNNVEGYSVSASFNDIGSLTVGSDVKVSGVKVGSVNKIALDPEMYTANVFMDLNKDFKLPEDSSAYIGSEGLLGGAFLALQPGGAEDYLSNGDSIYITQDAQNLERLLGQFIFSLNDSKKSE